MKFKIQNSKFKIILLLLLLTGCVPEEVKERGKLYFDVAGFMKEEVAELAKRDGNVEKVVIFNGREEKKLLQTLNWEEELQPFIESDINKPAWDEKYKIDSTEGRIAYTALDEELLTQKLIIEREGGEVKRILIQNRTDNVLYASVQNLTYVPGSSYIIEGMQKVRFLTPDSFFVKGEFLD